MSNNKNRSSKNLKINTRIVITALLAILIPVVIIASFSTVIITKVSSYFNFSSVTSNSYSTINHMQWSQTLQGIANALLNNEKDETTAEDIKEFVAPLEKFNSVIYIEKNGKLFYSTENSECALNIADKIVSLDKTKNINYFGDNGLVIIDHAKKGNDTYVIVIVNENYTVDDAYTRISAKAFSNLLLGRTGIIALIIVLLFIISIVVISLITSRTITEPIKKIAIGADEIARGNLDYKIDYKSTNELGQTVDSFNSMRTRLKHSIEEKNIADEKRKELIAGIAHDVRTPLTSAKGYAEGLLDGIASTPEKQEQYIKTIISSINDTEKILNELLNVSQLELNSYRLNMVNISIKNFIDDGVEDIKRTLTEIGFEFTYFCNCSEEAVVSIDTDAFQRVISNIISNSIKYSRDNVKGKIWLNLNEYDKSVILEIRDNGIGVDKQSLTKIFDTMFRADPARTKTSEGSGLGLSICKQLVELHNGLIWASSNNEHGLSVFISLPKKELEK